MNTFDDQHEAGRSPNELPYESHQPSHQNVRTDDILTAIVARLNALPTRQTVTLADAIKTLAPTVRKLRNRGYSIDECAAELTVNGLKISGRTLARLTAAAKPKKRAGQA